MIYIDENYNFVDCHKKTGEFIFIDAIIHKYAQNRSGWNLWTRNIFQAWKGLTVFGEKPKIMDEPKLIT
jgi:hypothetical protein